MKNIMVFLALSISSLVQAKSLVCNGSPVPNSGAAMMNTVEVSASNLDGNGMKDVVVQVTYDRDNKLQRETGRAGQLEVDRAYNPRVYTNHLRFNLGHLTNTKDSGPFQPVDQCQMLLMIPLAAATQNRFVAPVVIHCDQSGGSMTLSCVLQ